MPLLAALRWVVSASVALSLVACTEGAGPALAVDLLPGAGDAGTDQGAAGPDLLAGCQGLPLCEDFEGAAAGGPPDPGRWAVVAPNCAGTGTVAVDGTQGHGGAKSLKVNGKGGYCNHVFIAHTAVPGLGKQIYGRFYLRLQGALEQDHVTFLALRDSADGNKDLRMGGQSGILMWNRESDDATLPELSPAGIALSVRPAPQTWRCVEFHIDGEAGQIETWVDGAAVAGLRVDGTATQDVDAQWLRRPGWRPTLTDLRLGWESYGGAEMTLWFDDVALAPRRIGC